MSDAMPSWEEWSKQLTQGQRDYSIYKIMASMDKRLDNLESRRWKAGCLTLIGSFIGGFTAVGASVLAKLGLGDH